MFPQADIRAKVNEFYKIHNPAKIDQLDSIFFKYKGRGQELLKDLEARYGKIDGSAADVRASSLH